MTRPPWEVADIIRRAGDKFFERYCDSLTWTQLKVLRAIARCRTAALGGHRDQCVRCGHQAISYNSCRNRHCPKCQTNAREKWLCARRQELLPVCYFHLVFSVPHALVPLIWQNKRYLFGLLFDASAATLLEVAADPARLGAEIGFLSILHTWGQTLQRHPHVHCVVPGGGLSPDHSRWIRSAPHFFLPVRVLSRVFRGKFVAGLRRAFQRKQLVFLGPCQLVGEREGIRSLLAHSVSGRLGRLCQGSLWRAGARASVPGPLYPSSGHLESSPPLGGWRSRHLSLEGLRASQYVPCHDSDVRRVPASVLTACSAQGSSTHPLLWLAR